MKRFLFPISPSKNNRCPFNTIRYNADFSELKGLRSLPFISYCLLPIRHAITAPIPSYLTPNGRRKYRITLYQLFNIQSKQTPIQVIRIGTKLNLISLWYLLPAAPIWKRVFFFSGAQIIRWKLFLFFIFVSFSVLTILSP